MLRITEDFHTLRWYEEALDISPAMEDYLEMLVRIDSGKGVRLTDLAAALHVGVSAASKMAAKLRTAGFAEYEPYGTVQLTDTGKAKGNALISRHDILSEFFCLLNSSESELALVERIEHFFDAETVENLRSLINKMKNDAPTRAQNDRFSGS